MELTRKGGAAQPFLSKLHELYFHSTISPKSVQKKRSRFEAFINVG